MKQISFIFYFDRVSDSRMAHSHLLINKRACSPKILGFFPAMHTLICVFPLPRKLKKKSARQNILPCKVINYREVAQCEIYMENI